MSERRVASLPAPGLPCPECKTRIVVDARQLLANSAVSCAGCGLVLMLNRAESASALDALQRYMTELDRQASELQSRVEAATRGRPVPSGRRLPQRRRSGGR